MNKTAITTEKLVAQPEIRWVSRDGVRILQQKHEVLILQEVNDGYDGGRFWSEMCPSGKFRWVDVKECAEDDIN